MFFIFVDVVRLSGVKRTFAFLAKILHTLEKMVNNKKINVKERFSDGEIDLSMSDLDDVPVKEIAALKKTTSLDLSNNRLTTLPNNFTILTNLTKLDLSKNELSELPEDFGSLTKLRYLDLYKNNLERLPISFRQLQGLRFLDLKDNPLIPAISKIAGPCVDTKGCQQCAKDVVNFYRKLQEEVDNEVEMRQQARQKQLQKNQQKKQEEKKKKKKETKAKKEEEKEVIPQDTIMSKKASKKDSKKNNNKILLKKKSSILFPIFKYLFFLLLLTLLTLFVLTSLNLKQTQFIQTFFSKYYAHLTEKLPPNYKAYALTFSGYTREIHEKTGNTTLELIEFLRKNEALQGVFNKFREGYNSFIHSTASSK